MKTKICLICGKNFKVRFHNHKYCSKECSKIVYKEYRKKSYNKYRKKWLLYANKYIREHKEERKKYYEINKSKILKQEKEYKLRNRLKILKQAKLYREKHKNEIRKKNKIYRRTHKEQRRKYLIEREKININFKLVRRLRHRVYKALKEINKSKSTLNLLGCSLEFLKQYLKKQFRPGMSWDNYGKWHVDHIKPCASFDLSKTSEQRKCFHYTNLQPLWAKENLRKQAKLEGV